MNTNGHKSKILVVDDTRENLDMLMDALSLDYNAIPASNGESALRKAHKTPQPELILLDVKMPDMDGFEVCKRLKEDPTTREIPIIFLTMATDQKSELYGLNLGAVDYIHKPISTPLVLARVATHLELAHNRKELAKRNEALEESVRLRDDMDRITRHDLKGPLTAVIGFPEVILFNATLNDEHKKLLNSITQAGYLMLDMINRSLDLHKMETKRYHYTPSPFDLAEVARRVVSDLNPLSTKYNVLIELYIDNLANKKVSHILYADPMLCYSMLSNLLKNAIEAAPITSTITLRIDTLEKGTHISIHNQGTVPEEIHTTFFEKYSTFGKGKGTGLGTYSAKLMAETQEGTISMQSVETKGTTLTIFLPPWKGGKKIDPSTPGQSIT